ncbi:MAG TPA: hypothetical protein V6D33_11685 [Cyanophyceae cyanobacterium]
MMNQPPQPIMTINEKCPNQQGSPLPGCDRRVVAVVLELERISRDETNPHKVANYRDAIALLGDALQK